ncbi:hypothetical protein WMY93_030735 [Mugilogobius chulae]|uniref:Uncharacterized protein n=1 Tax=Mugilogobius chulae TaxID=88201 RepID=A0AAW0MFX2_9GOBI
MELELSRKLKHLADKRKLGSQDSDYPRAQCLSNPFFSCHVPSRQDQGVDCPSAPHVSPLKSDITSQKRTQTPPSEARMGQPLTNGLALFRAKRQLERRGPTHLSQSSLPGAVTVKDFQTPSSRYTSLLVTTHHHHTEPQAKELERSKSGNSAGADRSRRHLVQAANKKKSKRKSRVGSYSLLTHDKSTPLQVSLHGNGRAQEQQGRHSGSSFKGRRLVVRARRQVKNEPPSRGKIDRSGAFSVLGDPQNEGQNSQPK